MEMQKRNPQIKPDEYEFVKERAALVKDVGMMASRQARISYKGESVLGVDLQGITDNIPAINNVQVDVGRGITYEEVRRHAPVAFIGNDIRDALLRGARSARKNHRGRRAALRGGRRRQDAGQRVRAIAGQLRDDPDRELLQDLRQPQRHPHARQGAAGRST